MTFMLFLAEAFQLQTLIFSSSLPAQTLVPPSARRLLEDTSLTGAALLTGSNEPVWAASTQPTSPRSASSTTYLRALASASASSTPTPTTGAATTRAAAARRTFTDFPATGAGQTAAAAVYNRSAVKLVTASCWVASRTECGCTTAASTPCSSTRPLWTHPALLGWAWKGWCRVSPSKSSIMSAPAGWRRMVWSLTRRRGPGTPTVSRSVLLKDGVLVTRDSSSLPVPAGWRCSWTTTDSAQTHSPDSVSSM